MSQKCPYCSSGKRIWCKGWRYNQSGKKQMWWCNYCKRRFTPDDGFWKMKHKPEVIAEACSSYRRGMSFNSVSKHFREYAKAKICSATVFNWVKKYTKITKHFTDKLKPKIRGRIHQDEVVVNVMGKKSLSLEGQGQQNKI